MTDNHKLGLYVSYYLSRFDKIAYSFFGLGTQAKTHQYLGTLLKINPHTIKNWRDEFDPLHGHRAGWHQREMVPSRLAVVEALQDLEEFAIREIVLDILKGDIVHHRLLKEKLISIVNNGEKKGRRSGYTSRGPTGKKAEEYFIEYFNKFKLPINGDLKDCRELGVGYDFLIDSGGEQYLIEVKGVGDSEGGILFTSKEWETALNSGSRFFLVLVTNLNNTPKISFIRNPCTRLKPQRNLIELIQVSYSVTKNELKGIIND